jgi:hypothetical protein
VVDEFATVIGCCDRKWVDSFNAKLQKIVQMGNSKNRFLWIINQSGNLAELKLQSSLRSSLELLAIVRPGSDAAVASLIKTDLIADKDTERMQAMMQRSPVGRAYYYGKFPQWSPMPELPNLSGYDRDSRKWMDRHTPSEPMSKPTEFPVEAVSRAVGESSWSAVADKPSKPKPKVKRKTAEGDWESQVDRGLKWYRNRVKKGKDASLEEFKKAIAYKNSGMEFITDPGSVYQAVLQNID